MKFASCATANKVHEFIFLNPVCAQCNTKFGQVYHDGIKLYLNILKANSAKSFIEKLSGLLLHKTSHLAHSWLDHDLHILAQLGT